MIKLIIFFFLLISTYSLSFAQNITNQKVWQVPSSKKSSYINQGIFHSLDQKEKSTLTNIRYRFDSKEKYERIVIDFDTNFVPKIYGHIAKKEHKLFLDLFNTQLGNGNLKFDQSAYLKSANFYPLTPEMLSIELVFKNEIGIDLFYLENPGRLVIDVKNI